MNANLFETATLLAADLAGSNIDVNEAQKTLAYLRSKREGQALFDYLRAVESSGNIFVRSRQTMDYYRNLRAACERHLRDLQDDYDALVKTYAWSLRLLRYYKTVPNATPQRSDVSSSPARREPAVEPPKPQPAPLSIPPVGEIFSGEILAIDDQGIRTKVKNLSPDEVIAIVKTEQLGGKQYQVGNIARLEVIASRTTSSGLVVLECKPAPKKKK